METKKAAEEFLMRAEEQDDKRTCDFATLLLLGLKRKLYDRLKQGCFRLGYRPNKNVQLHKNIVQLENDGDFSGVVEMSEPSTLTDRTNSVRSDVFYMCDGQWRSSDWQSLGVTTTTKRQNSMTVVRRRQVNISPKQELDDDFDAKVSTFSGIDIIQTSLPWFLPWVLTLLTFLLMEKPTPSQLQKRRKQHNLKKVRSIEYRSAPRHSLNRGMRTILPSGNSSLLLLTKSLPTYTRPSSTDASKRKRMISKQCVAVAKVNRLPVTGLPPCPRLIMTPPSSPCTTPRGSETKPKSTSEPPSAVPSPKESAPKIETHQSFKILRESPRKVVIEIDNNEQLGGLLSQHFAQHEANKLEASMPSSPSVKKSEENRTGFDANETPEGFLAKYTGRSTVPMASDNVEEQGDLSMNSSRPALSRKARAINMLKARKAKDREMARSRDSQTSVETMTSQANRNGEEHSKEALDSEGMPSSQSSSFTEEFVCEQLESGRVPMRTRRQDSMKSLSTSAGSSFTLDSDLPSMSTQTYELIRQNSTFCTKDLPGSFTSSIAKWPSIDEETSMEMTDPAPPKLTVKTQRKATQEETQKEDVKLKMEMWNPQMKPSAMKMTVSAVAAASNREPVTPKPQRPFSDSDDLTAHAPCSVEKTPDGVKESKPQVPKKAPPPPPPKAKSKTSATKAVNAPPPPTRENTKGKKSTAPPPPAPGGKSGRKNGSAYRRSTEVIRIFQEVRKISKNKGYQPRPKPSKTTTESNNLSSQGSGGDLIKELEKTSSFFAQVQSDVEKHGPEIQKMIQDINSRKFETMSELNSFVKVIDERLETFADETAVLRHFDWPHKFYVYREALALWLELRNRSEKCHKWMPGSRGISAELNRMKKQMDLNLRRLDEVQRTLEAEVKKFMRNGIPWDTTVPQKVNDGTMCLLEKYMQIVYDEVSRTQTKATNREKNLQYLTDTINLTFKIHQFVGGLTESCTSLFEKIASFTRTLTDL